MTVTDTTDLTTRTNAAIFSLLSAPSIAHELRLYGITGTRNAMCGCPIANYLRARAGAKTVYVTGLLGSGHGRWGPAVWVSEHEKVGQSSCALVPLPTVIATWAKEFDTMRWPEFDRGSTWDLRKQMKGEVDDDGSDTADERPDW